MKKSISFWDFRKAFEDCGRGDQFSYEALKTMFDFYEELEDETGEEIELDPIAFCCEWTEYDLMEMYNDYSNIYDFESWFESVGDIYSPEEVEAGEAMDDFLEGDFLEEMERNTTILKVTGTNTYLVMAF